MKCNPLRWLLGLLPLTILWWIGVLGTKSRIEDDLKQRTTAYLEQSQLPWAQATFNGRDALIGGRAEDDSEKPRAASQAAKVWGVRTLEDRTEVLEVIKDYRWRAALGAGDVTLTGYVPNEAARKAVLASASRALPNRKVNDQMKLARGAPEQKVWLGGTDFAIRQLANLRPGGSAGLEATGLVIQGETDNAKSYETVRTALNRSLPQGVRLKAENVTPPRVSPYTWAANFRARQVELTGYAPSMAAREAIKEAADRSFAGIRVVNNMSIASGAPANWQGMATAAIAKLAQLKQGSAEARDQSFSITGLTETAETAAAVRSSLRADVPSTFAVREDVRQDPAVVAAEEARKAAEAAAARRAAEEAAARRKAEEDARLAAEASAKAEEAARQRQAASSTDQQRVATAEDEARRKAAAEAAARERAAAEAAARERAAAAEAAERQRAAAARAAAEEAAVRARIAAAEEEARRKTAEAQRCQRELTTAAATGIRFRRASADVERESYRTLDALSQILKTCPGFKVEIAGHTDNEGVPERNQMWSDRRANSVRDYLVRAGVPQDSLIAVGYGETKPKVPNDSPANMAINRRIEFSVRTK